MYASFNMTFSIIYATGNDTDEQVKVHVYDVLEIVVSDRLFLGREWVGLDRARAVSPTPPRSGDWV